MKAQRTQSLKKTTPIQTLNWRHKKNISYLQNLKILMANGKKIIFKNLRRPRKLIVTLKL